MLGRNAGAGVYGMLYGFRSAAGAVPKDVNLAHLRGSVRKGVAGSKRKSMFLSIQFIDFLTFGLGFEDKAFALWGGRDESLVEEAKDLFWDASDYTIEKSEGVRSAPSKSHVPSVDSTSNLWVQLAKEGLE